MCRTTTTPTHSTHYDTIVIGAGISGIDAAYHLKTHRSNTTFLVLERAASIGGTWAFFKYPGLRSDSDMVTFGYSWKSWGSSKPIAEAPEILSYLNEAVDENNLRQYIKFNAAVSSAHWSSTDACWRVQTASGEHYTCRWVVACTGYYHYEKGYTPEFPGIDTFKNAGGQVVHPQEWGDDIEYEDKKVVVIGSGATAITLLPNLVKGKAKHVTMLQRSPTYIYPAFVHDNIGRLLLFLLPAFMANFLIRWKNIIVDTILYWFCIKTPWVAKALMIRWMRQQVPQMPEPEFKRNFTPRYNPWEQRVCLSPGGDFFKPLRDGTATIKTDQIESFTETGITLQSGEQLPADLVVTATGLTLAQEHDKGKYACSGIEMFMDGQQIVMAELMTYRGCMLSTVPNFAFAFGYTNISWTLKIDITCRYICKMMNYMEDNGHAAMIPTPSANVATDLPSTLQSGYVQRSLKFLPKSGSEHPWKVRMNYIADAASMYWSSLAGPTLRYVPKLQVGSKKLE